MIDSNKIARIIMRHLVDAHNALYEGNCLAAARHARAAQRLTKNLPESSRVVERSVKDILERCRQS